MTSVFAVIMVFVMIGKMAKDRIYGPGFKSIRNPYVSDSLLSGGGQPNNSQQNQKPQAED